MRKLIWLIRNGKPDALKGEGYQGFNEPVSIYYFFKNRGTWFLDFFFLLLFNISKLRVEGLITSGENRERERDLLLKPDWNVLNNAPSNFSKLWMRMLYASESILFSFSFFFLPNRWRIVEGRDHVRGYWLIKIEGRDTKFSAEVEKRRVKRRVREFTQEGKRKIPRR